MNKFFLAFVSAFLLNCSRTVSVPPAQVLDRSFPKVKGQSLAGKEMLIPDAFAGKATLLLIGYQMKTQFDIDRWILGVLQADVPVEIVELPTIPGMMPQMVQHFIDNGMRSGIPKSDWASVVTVYGDAQVIVNAIGNERPNNTQVVLLDKSGKIRWLSDQGYSAGQVLELKKLVESLS